MKNLTELIFILDRSGSMSGLADETIKGFNAFIEQQKKIDGEMVINTILFDNNYEILHDCQNIKDIKPITSKDYYVRGMTALNDAIGKSINEIGDRIAKTKKKDRPENVIVIITTDGEENSSREYTSSAIKDLIEKKKKDDWGFIFMGADIDSFATGSSMGIGTGGTTNYHKSSIGTQAMYSTISMEVSNCRVVEGATSKMGDSGNLAQTYQAELDKLKK